MSRLLWPKGRDFPLCELQKSFVSPTNNGCWQPPDSTIRQAKRRFASSSHAPRTSRDLGRSILRRGGVARGLLQAGFDEVIGVDIKPQGYCGTKFVQADALTYLKTADLSRVGLIWASPPCPRFSELRHAPGAKGDAHPDLITPTRAALMRIGKPFVIENVEGAKTYLRNPIMLCGTSFGLGTAAAPRRAAGL